MYDLICVPRPSLLRWSSAWFCCLDFRFLFLDSISFHPFCWTVGLRNFACDLVYNLDYLCYTGLLTPFVWSALPAPLPFTSGLNKHIYWITFVFSSGSSVLLCDNIVCVCVCVCGGAFLTHKHNAEYFIILNNYISSFWIICSDWR